MDYIKEIEETIEYNKWYIEKLIESKTFYIHCKLDKNWDCGISDIFINGEVFVATKPKNYNAHFLKMNQNDYFNLKNTCNRIKYGK